MFSSPKSSTTSYHVCSNENPLIPMMLSELAFNKEHDVIIHSQQQQASPMVLNGKQQLDLGHNLPKSTHHPQSSNLTSWAGLLFCFSFEDPDMFYDAEEMHMDYDHDGRHILTPEEEEMLRQLRGGYDGRGEHYTPTPNNPSSRRSSRRITLPATPPSPTEGHTNKENAGNLTINNNHNTIAQSYTAGSNHFSEVLHSSMSINSLQGKNSTSSPPCLSPTSITNSPRRCAGPSTFSRFGGVRAPPAPEQLPVRFLRAGKGDVVEGQRRYEATLQWRQENNIDTILLEPHPNFEVIKSHYPHYYHLRGHNGEPVFFEQPPKTNLAALKAGGIDLKSLVRHYAMVTEFQWQYIERDDFARSITVLDLEGMRMRDFVGECVEYVKMCSQFTGQHYPERAGHVIVINVPRWFSMIWNVVKPMVDEVTLRKITIVRGDKEVFEALAAKIPIQNIPPEYGGYSMPLGQSPEELSLRELMAHNNALARGDYSCGGRHGNSPCRICSWGPARSY